MIIDEAGWNYTVTLYSGVCVVLIGVALLGTIGVLVVIILLYRKRFVSYMHIYIYI